MTSPDQLAGAFEQHRTHLRAVAYRMLGSLSEADDAVQETWLRLRRTDPQTVDNLGAWLTTVTSRVCLNMLRARRVSDTRPLDTHVPDPVVSVEATGAPERDVVLAESISLALLVVLETLPPAERLAFVLHDLFGVPFEEVASIVDKSPAAARQLASRARRRVRGATPERTGSPDQQRRVVDAFFAAARDGEFDELVALLDPDIVLRADFGPARASALIRGANAVAGRAMMFVDASRHVRAAVINGDPGVVVTVDGRLASIMAFTVVADRIVEIDVLGDPDRLTRLHISQS